MPIRPIDIRRKEFKSSFRGYDPNQVDDFLDAVADEFERTYTENQRMREEVSSLRDRLQQFEDLEGSIRAASSTPSKHPMTSAGPRPRRPRA
jgi:cell division initiation protein